MRVDIPANFGLEQVTPAQVAAQDPALIPFIGPKAQTALFQDDPSGLVQDFGGLFMTPIPFGRGLRKGIRGDINDGQCRHEEHQLCFHPATVPRSPSNVNIIL